jgi:hypothetical protein
MIFYGSGGNPKNLKRAIFSGKGNKDKAVNGFDGFGMIEPQAMPYMNEYTAMPELLGTDIYTDENINGMQGFGELSEPVTLASIAAAAGVVAGIVAMLKDVGNIFQKKTKGAEDFDETKNEEADKNAPVVSPTVTPTTLPTVVTKENTDAADNTVKTALPAVDDNYNSVTKANPETAPEAKNELAPANNSENNIAAKTGADNNNDEGNPGFWEKNKKWLRPVAIGVGGLTIIGIGYSIMKDGKTQNKSSPPAKPLSGTPQQQKRKNHKRNKGKHHKKKAVALL